LPSVWRDI